MTDQAPPAAIGDDERKLPLVADANGERTELHGHVEAIFGTIRTVVIAFSLLFAVVGGGLGFFGWRTTSDIGATIDASADSRIGRLIEGTNDANASLTRSIEELTSQVTSISDRARRLLGDIESAEQTLQIVDAGLTDPIGDYLRIQTGDSVDPLDVEQRRKAETVFRRLIEQSQSEQGGVPGDTLFNAAATASAFEMRMLGARLAKAAYETDRTSVHEARMLRFELMTNEILAEDAYQRMRQLSESAPRHQMHLTLSELFNLTFVIGRFEEFTQMLDDLKARLGDGAISYVWLLQAQVLLGNGGSTHVSRAVTELEQGLRLLQDESPSAVWYGESVEQAQLVLAISGSSMFSRTCHPASANLRATVRLKLWPSRALPNHSFFIFLVLKNERSKRPLWAPDTT